MSKSNWWRRVSAAVAMVGVSSVIAADYPETYRASVKDSGEVIVGQYATRQFNNALGQVFADRFIANVVTDAEVCPGLTSFVKAYGGFGSEGNQSRRAGYDLGNAGVLAGLGYQLGKELELGGLVGYSYNNATSFKKSGTADFNGFIVDITDFQDDLTDNVLRVGFYGNYKWNNLFVNTSPTVGVHFLSDEEHITVGYAANSVDSSKISRYDTGFDFSWYNRVGYVFELPKGFYLTPSYSLAMTYLHTASATGGEDTTDRYNLTYRNISGNENNWSLLQTLDARLGKVFNLSDNFAILPEFIAGWEHEYIDPKQTGAYVRGGTWDKYTAPIQGIAQDRAILGVGLSTIIAKKYEVSARYDERLWGDGHNSNFTVGLSVKF
ncbi:MAG: autotransporter outer membrane beta-barrel domain-containing protein [Planctomycetota bacterium]|nr:autotransporter outer membrane beta-barrel domain-containing protein [Planctomycetota bacterium]